MIKHLRIAALVAALLAPACASLPLVIQVAGYTVSAMEVAIQAVQTFAHSGVVTDPAKLQKIDIDIADANAAVAAFQSLVNAGADLKDKNVAAALGDFEVAWADLEGLLKDLGVMTAPLSSRAGVTQVAGRLVLPSAESLMPPGVDMAAVHARAASRKAASEQALRSPGAAGQVVFTMAEESLIPWDPILLLHPDGRIESSWLPQWLAVPIAMGLAAR